MELALVIVCGIILCAVIVWAVIDDRRFERHMAEYQTACDKALREAIERDYQRRVLKKWGVEDESKD